MPNFPLFPTFQGREKWENGGKRISLLAQGPIDLRLPRFAERLVDF